MTIGIIGEGLSDYYTIRSILQGFTEDKNFVPTRLVPQDEKTPAGWTKVFDFCRSGALAQALTLNNYLIVQIDTDVFVKGDGLPPELLVEGMASKTPAERIDILKGLLVAAMGEEFYQANQGEIIFAIAVDEIECWFLSIYYTDSRAEKHQNCKDTINRALAKRDAGFTLDEKREEYYKPLSEPFRKRKTLMKHSQPNDSFAAFIAELHAKLPQSTA